MKPYDTSNITICIPTYDRVFGLAEAINSALAQDPRIKIIIIDNATPHEAIENIVRDFDSSRITFIRNESNIGVFGNWNKCAHVADTEFIAILGSDDILAPDFVSTCVETLNEHPDVDFVYGRYTAFEHDITDAYDKGPIPVGLNEGIALCEMAAVSGLCFPVCYAIRRSLLINNPFREKPHGMNDWLWVYSTLSKHRIFGHDRPLAYWRTHGDQDSVTAGLVVYITYPEIMHHVVTQLSHDETLRQKAVVVLRESIMHTMLRCRKNGKWHKPDFFDAAMLPKHISTKVLIPYISGSIHLRAMTKLNGITWKIYSIIPRLFRKLGLPFA